VVGLGVRRNTEPGALITPPSAHYGPVVGIKHRKEEEMYPSCCIIFETQFFWASYYTILGELCLDLWRAHSGQAADGPGTGAGAERGEAESAPPQRPVLIARASADCRCDRSALISTTTHRCTDQISISLAPTPPPRICKPWMAIEEPEMEGRRFIEGTTMAKQQRLCCCSLQKVRRQIGNSL
jgi:hypothetical protein